MKNTCYKASKEAIALSRIETLYREMISMSFDEQERRTKILEELIKYQNEDGSWRVIDTLHGDSDCIIHYAYVPTYYATAAIMHEMNLNKNSEYLYEEDLGRGLDFIIGIDGTERRRFPGHGFDAERDVLEALKIYKDAGVYKWMKNYGHKYNKFSNMIRTIIEGYREALRTGCTWGGFGENFEEKYDKEVRDYEEEFLKDVWYVAYGSNIDKDRFMEYVKCCSDQAEPTESKAYMLMYDIYFAEKSRRWGRKGVAYLDTSKVGKAFGKAYKIKKSQLDEIQQAEGYSYRHRIYLGKLDGIPAYTFTSPVKQRDLNPPCVEYANIILKGLCETYPDRSELVFRKYLCDRGMLNEDDRRVLEAVRTSEHGITLREIALVATNSAVGRVKSSVKRLAAYGMLKQDSRSVEKGHDLNSLDAVVYTEKERRELIDLIIL